MNILPSGFLGAPMRLVATPGDAGQAATPEDGAEPACGEAARLPEGRAPGAAAASVASAGFPLASAAMRSSASTLEALWREQPTVDPRRAQIITDFVRESNSPDGRALKCRGMGSLLALRPDLSAGFLSATARFVNESTSIQGRRLKMEALVGLLESRPAMSEGLLARVATVTNQGEDLEGRRVRLEAFQKLIAALPGGSDETIGVAADFVGSSSAGSVRAEKMELLQSMWKADPTAPAGTVAAVKTFVDESTSPEGRTMKCRGLRGLFAARPGVTPAFISRLGSYVNQGADVTSRGARLDAVVKMVASRPGISEDEALNLAGFVGTSTSSEIQDLKRQTLEHLQKLQPPPAPDVIGAVASFVDESNSAEGRRLKLESLDRMFATSPSLSAAHVNGVARLVNESTGIEGRRLKLGALEGLLRLRPDLPAGVIEGTATYVNQSGDLDGRRVRLDHVKHLVGEYPDVPGAVFSRAATVAVAADGSAETPAVLDVAVPELSARALLAAHPPVDPATGGALPADAALRAGMALMQKLDADPMVRLASRALQSAEKSLARSEVAASCDQGTLFSLDRELYTTTWTHEWEKKKLWITLSAVGTMAVGAAAMVAAGSFLPALAPFRSLIGSATAAMGLFVVPTASRKLLERTMPAAVEKTMRARMGERLDGWKNKVADLKDLHGKAREVVLQRLWSEHAIPDTASEQAPPPATRPPGTVTMGNDEVVIGGVRINRRAEGGA